VLDFFNILIAESAASPVSPLAATSPLPMSAHTSPTNAPAPTTNSTDTTHDDVPDAVRPSLNLTFVPKSALLSKLAGIPKISSPDFLSPPPVSDLNVTQDDVLVDLIEVEPVESTVDAPPPVPSAMDGLEFSDLIDLQTQLDEPAIDAAIDVQIPSTQSQPLPESQPQPNFELFQQSSTFSAPTPQLSQSLHNLSVSFVDSPKPIVSLFPNDQHTPSLDLSTDSHSEKPKLRHVKSIFPHASPDPDESGSSSPNPLDQSISAASQLMSPTYHSSLLEVQTALSINSEELVRSRAECQALRDMLDRERAKTELHAAAGLYIHQSKVHFAVLILSWIFRV
jgi:hypothetical protein